MAHFPHKANHLLKFQIVFEMLILLEGKKWFRETARASKELNKIKYVSLLGFQCL